MDEARALERVSALVNLIDEHETTYDLMYKIDQHQPLLAPRLKSLDDQVRRHVRFVRSIAEAAGEREIAAALVEYPESYTHSWRQARKALLEFQVVLGERQALVEIIGPAGPRLSAAALHPVIWSAAASLWDGGHPRQAVQTAGQALESLMQVHAGPGVVGENLAILFSTKPPTDGSPRLRVRGIAPESHTWRSVHEGAAGLVRGSMMAVRNLVSHPGWDDPTEDEALEMLAVMSYTARLVDRCDLLAVNVPTELRGG